jgi:hypothetical protein
MTARETLQTLTFVQTNDLVRFRVRAGNDVFKAIENGCPWDTGLRFTELAPLEFEFTIPKCEAHRVLDVLERHAVARVETLA